LEASFDVGDRRRVQAFPRDEDHVQRAVEFAVSASVEPVADGLAGGGGDRRCAGKSREGGFGSDAAVV